ncbi:MAG: adenylate/guanylate cyclase domain-containing protein [Bacteroidales bacterium]|nr:adenylate/guanylate cyclase domain-containing protein [Bacteroidales bacterium]
MPYPQIENLKSFLLKASLSGLLSGAFIYLLFNGDWKVYLLGIMIGFQVYSWIFLYEYFLERKLKQFNFFLSLLTSTIFYVLIIIFSVITSMIIFNGFNFRILQQEVLQQIFFSDAMLYGVVFGLFMSFLFSSYSMFDTLLGKNFLIKLFTGKYHKPFEEERIFMFLDMKSSTSIAEQIGHKKFLSLLNDFFYDLSIPVLETGGEIYKYVGDEAIISWKMKRAIKNANPLKCFFMLQELIAQNSDKYLKLYNIVPQFKAGIHGGIVVTGEMGFIKKEITFLGDVMNTTARIEEACNEFNRQLIISDVMLRKMLPADEYLFQTLGEIKFRGKAVPVAISSVDKKINLLK